MFTGRRLFYGDSDYQTVELVRQARVPSIAALNPEVEPELEAIVRKSLARDANDRYQNANDLGDALTQYLFSHRMKVTARDIATLVRDAQVEMMRKRSAEPKESLIDALINDEMNKMTSLVEGEEGGGAEGSNPLGASSLDPSSFVDTAGWAGELAQGPATPSPKKQTKPPQNRPRNTGQGIPQTPSPGGEVESLEQMLEPDRTGVHGKKAEKPTPWLLIIALMVLLAAAAAIVVIFAMK
jgi:serine/threonine-protein kinase